MKIEFEYDEKLYDILFIYAPAHTHSERHWLVQLRALPSIPYYGAVGISAVSLQAAINNGETKLREVLARGATYAYNGGQTKPDLDLDLDFLKDL